MESLRLSQQTAVAGCSSASRAEGLCRRPAQTDVIGSMSARFKRVKHDPAHVRVAIARQ